MSEHCVWKNIFGQEDKEKLHNGLFIIGVISVAISTWLNLALLRSDLVKNPTYRNLALFTVTSGIRRFFPLIGQLRLVKFLDSWIALPGLPCDLYAFWETFLAVFEVESLTHICIERYVVTKYISNGWLMKKSHYFLFLCLIFFFSTIYSYAPVVGIGRYGYDFTCDSCTFDMVLPVGYQRYATITIFILRSIKPVIFMFTMLFWANTLQKKFDSKTQYQHRFTKSAAWLTLICLLCWAPIAIVRGFVVFNQLFEDKLIMPSAESITYAMWIHWVTPAVSAMILFLTDDRLRQKMVTFNGKEEKQKGR